MNEEGAPTYRGYIIGQTDDYYTVISERDKQLHQLPKEGKKIPSGATVMPDGHICNIDEIFFNNTKLFSACREYSNDLRRHKKYWQDKKAAKAAKVNV